MAITVIIIRVWCVEVFSVVAYIGLICGQVGMVGLLPALVLALPLVRFWVVGAF
jgi:hypothetical protein